MDECDRLFEPSFRDQLAQIFNICARSSKLKHAMFSATYDPHLHEWCKLNLTDIATVFIGGRNKVADTVDQKLVFTGTETVSLNYVASFSLTLILIGKVICLERAYQ